MTFRVRLATGADAATIARLQLASWRSAYAGLLPAAYLAKFSDEERADDWRQLLSQGDHTVFVAESGEGETVGFGCTRPDPSPEAPAPVFIPSLHVLPRRRRQGIGQVVLAAISEHYRRQGAAGFYLWVLKDNLPARRFYEAMEGELCREERHDLGGAMADEVAYRWRLASGT